MHNNSWPAKLLALALLLAFPAAASADLGPTPSELAHAEQVAHAYWHAATAPCGSEGVYLATTLAPDISGEALYDGCAVVIDVAYSDWPRDPAGLCLLYAHELGHLVLGATYFAASNPADPAHSPDPLNVMAAEAPSYDDELAQERTAGCVPRAPVTARHRRHHRLRQHRRP